jgi:uncharacterized protein (DUF2252 family)
MNSIIERIEQFNADRDFNYLLLKYQAMAKSPFRFFRGTCHLFYEDFLKMMNWKDSSRTWICGDLHLENFGTFKGDNGLVYFDMNDFDEAILAPATWEIARTITSIYLAAIDLKLSDKKTDAMANDFLDNYIAVLQKGKSIVIERPTAKGVLKQLIDQVSVRTNKVLIKERTVIKKGLIQLMVDNKRAFALNAEKKKSVQQFFEDWAKQLHPKKYDFIDAAYRIAGTGSIGIARYVILLQKRKDRSFVLVDMKQAKISSLKKYVSVKQPKWNNEAERVVDIQKMVQHVSPAFIKPVLFEQKYFVLKQLQPMADKMDLALCKGKLNKLETILQTMAEVAASGQLRSTGRKGSSTADELIALANNHKQWRNELLLFAKKYAKQVQSDYKIFCNSSLLK